MPILQDDYLVRNPLFSNAHISSIYSTQFRKIDLQNRLHRQRFETPDGDFIDCDLSEKSHRRVAFLFHGFEGNSTRPYMKGMSRHLARNQWDVVAVNLRGCSGEPNRLPRAYHAGDIDDVAFIVETIAESRQYEEASVIGFSLGGNIILNYLSRHTDLPAYVVSGVAISTPIDLRQTVHQIMKRENWIYNNNFYKKLVRKMKEKQAIFPDILPYEKILASKNIDDFDKNYTVPVHGFEDTEDYRTKSSSLFSLHQLKRPALILNAQDDPFLTESCYPYDLAASSELLHLLTPKYGGHCGFWQSGDTFYHEEKTTQFIERFRR